MFSFLSLLKIVLSLWSNESIQMPTMFEIRKEFESHSSSSNSDFVKISSSDLVIYYYKTKTKSKLTWSKLLYLLAAFRWQADQYRRFRDSCKCPLPILSFFFAFAFFKIKTIARSIKSSSSSLSILFKSKHWNFWRYRFLCPYTFNGHVKR